ncbi:NADH-FMN oxidoreductase RutF, flavin reductase (DIM6/NTAB) family [Ruminococcaceae bacterium FB2012]|nr:NADH-FMN oxidoreductase RutF, flavin reductase (DIM6/NTAB) family [Ruminococcaceae bacterium FB2012]
MDTNALNNISYGLYVLTAADGGKLNGCIINTLSQVTSTPVRVSITVNKANFTCEMIQNSGSFNVSMLDQTADFSVFKHFGFASGRDTDKFADFEYKLADNGIPYIPGHTCAYLSGKVTESIDLGTHMMFIADVTAAEVLSDKAPMTYAYYHANVKPKPQAQASAGSGERWICNICGYIYEGHLPDDFICPLCKHGAADFSLMDDGKKEDADAPKKWVCSVCGYVYEGDLPEDFVCPICGVGADQFQPL